MKNSRTSSTRCPDRRRFFLLLVLLLAAAAALSLCLGAEAVNIPEAVRDLLRGENSAGANILRYARLPRTCAALLAGGALASAGVIIQGVLANSLAAPSTIGVNAGAGLAVTVLCAAVPGATASAPAAALLGAFGGAMLVLTIARRTGASRISLVLAGVAVSAIFSAGIDAVVTFVPDALAGYSDFRIGGLFNVPMRRLLPAALLIVPAFLTALSLRNELDLLVLGTEQARSLGLPARRLQIIFLGLAAVLAGSAISFAGLIGFVGLIVPHAMRRLVGEESGPLLLGSALGGALLLCGCDLISRLLFAPYELPVGIVMALVGGPFFLWLLRRRGGTVRD